MEISLATFALLALVVVVTPGPTVILALSNGSRFGLRAASYGIAGAALSDGVVIAAAGLGLGAVLAASVVLFNVVKWVGVAYLLWIGVQMLRSSGQLGVVPAQPNEQNSGVSGRKLALLRKSFLVAVTNPKGYVFFTAFLPQFIDPTAPLLAQYALLGLVFIATDVAVMVAYAGLGTKAVQFLSDRGALWIERSCGGLLIAMGCTLAFIRRGNA